VAGVTAIKCREKLGPGRWRTFGFAHDDILRISVAPSEILRIDNDKDQPQHGLLFVEVEAAL